MGPGTILDDLKNVPSEAAVHQHSHVQLVITPTGCHRCAWVQKRLRVQKHLDMGSGDPLHFFDNFQLSNSQGEDMCTRTREGRGSLIRLGRVHPGAAQDWALLEDSHTVALREQLLGRCQPRRPCPHHRLHCHLASLIESNVRSGRRLGKHLHTPLPHPFPMPDRTQPHEPLQ